MSSLIFYKYFHKNYNLSYLQLSGMILINFITFNLFELKDHLVLSLLLISSLTDIEKRIIPNFIPITITILSIKSIKIELYTLDLLIILIFALLILISIVKDSIGMGDVKLLFSIYLFKGILFFNSMIIILSFFMFLIAIFLLVKIQNYKESFPLAPLIFLSFLLARSII